MLGSKWPMFGAQYNRLLARPNRYRFVIPLLLKGWLMKLGPALNEKKGVVIIIQSKFVDSYMGLDSILLLNKEIDTIAYLI